MFTGQYVSAVPELEYYAFAGVSWRNKHIICLNVPALCR